MGIRVPLAAVVAELEVAGPERHSFLNRVTGEIVMCTEAELSAAEDDAGDDPDSPEWEQDALAQAREIIASDDWLELPDSFEIHEFGVMRDFARSLEGAEQADLLDALRGPGAFRHFKSGLDRLGLREEWFRFRHEAFVGIASGWLEENEVEFQ
jgi:hypothetical protein